MATPPQPTSGPKPDRLLSLDVMRGLTILAMILVNNPGDWGNLYWAVGHAAWHGWTPTDLIFPFFLFMVGVAMAYSFAKYVDGEGHATRAVWLRILRRVGLLILLGLALNASGQIIQFLRGVPVEWLWEDLRLPGVLQRIGLAYLIASLVVLRTNWLGRWVAALALLLLYTLILKLAPTDVEPTLRMEPESNAVLGLDRAVIGEKHMWSGAITDPEGLLSTLPSVVTVLIGYGVGRWLRANPLTAVGAGKLLATGLVVAGLGQAWDAGPHPGWGMPINKALWTPSFVLLTGGLGMVCLACCLLLFDLVGKDSPALKRTATAFQMVGVNAIFVFVASGFVARAMGVFEIGELSVKGWLHQNLCVEPLAAVGLSDPRLASLAYAAGFVGCWWLILWLMWRKNWSIRV